MKVSLAAVALVLFPPVLRKPRGFFPIDQSECVNFVYLRHKGTCVHVQGWCKQRSAKWDPNRFLERRTSHIFPLYVIYKSLYQPKLESWLRKSILNQVVKTMLQGVCGFLVTVLWFGNPIFLSNTALSAISMDSSGDFIREAHRGDSEKVESIQFYIDLKTYKSLITRYFCFQPGRVVTLVEEKQVFLCKQR